MITRLICMGGIVLLGACSTKYSTTGEHLYLQSINGPMPVIRAPLSDANISHLYVLPNAPEQRTPVSILPPSV